jgi:hypothetical protein
MKNVLKALALAATLVLPAAASAQAIDETVDVTLTGHPFPTKGTGFGDGFGGGFLANFSIDYPAQEGGTRSFNDWLVWCIDPNREVSVPGTYSYEAWTATNFAASNLGSVNGNDITEAQMRSIVSLVNTLQNGWNGFTELERQNLQGSIWATFRGENPLIAGDANASLEDWVVLYGNDNNQTFLTRVPEPSSLALVLVGLSGMMLVVARRRRA